MCPQGTWYSVQPGMMYDSFRAIAVICLLGVIRIARIAVYSFCCSLVLLRGRAGYTILLYEFFSDFFVKFVVRLIVFASRKAMPLLRSFCSP